MTVIREASTMYASFFSLILFMSLFESRYLRRKTWILTAGLMGPVMILNFILLALLGPETMSTLLLLTCSLPSLIFFWFLSKYRDGRFFFTFCFCDTIMLEIIYVTSILDYFLGNTYIFMAVSRLILCPVVVLAFLKWMRPSYLRLQRKVTRGWYTFAAISLIYYVLMSMAMSVPTMITQRLNQLPAFLLLLILLPVLYIYFFSTLHHLQKSYESDKQEKILSLQVTSLLSRVEEFSAANQRLQEERHDFRHKMRTIAVLAEKGDLETITHSIRDYTENSPSQTLESYCDHRILDAVLAFYLELAKRSEIRVTTQLAFPDVLPAGENELATAIANALENAISACEKLPPANRYIQIKSITSPCFMLQIRNSFDGIIAFDEDGIPLSPRKGHGFGTRSIAAFCGKNSAFCEFLAEDNAFTLQMVFNK